MCTGVEPIIAALATAAETTPEVEAGLGGIDALQAAGVGGMGVAQNGLGSGALAAQLAGAANNPASLLSSQGMPAGLLGKLSGGGGGGAGGLLAAQMGMNMMNPQQPQKPAQAMPSGGQSGPLPMPYGTQSGNSLGLTNNMDEARKRYLRMMGVQV